MMIRALNNRILKRLKTWLTVLLCGHLTTGLAADRPDAGPTDPDPAYRAAADYSRQHAGNALIILSQGQILFEDYTDGAEPDRPHRLASGTKTFWGLLAVAAAQDGLLDLDEPVSNTLEEWRTDPRKSRITVRQLLNFTSGLDPAVQALQGQPKSGDKFDQAIRLPAVAEPGQVFAYGPSHLFAFGAWLKRKLALAGRDSDPLAYLHQRLLDPIGLKIGHWMRDAAGNPIMPSGAQVAPHEWIKLGELIANDGYWQGRQLIDARYLNQIFQGSSANPAYGLTIWLNRDAGKAQGVSVADSRNARRLGRSDDGYIYREGPSDLAMAAGQGKQRLYIIPSQSLVILRQGDTQGGSGWLDREFLSLLPQGSTPYTNNAPPEPAEEPIRPTTPANLREACAADIERLCPEAEEQRGELRRCYRRFKDELSPDCRRAIEARRGDRD